jgi:4-hydroxy-tetrahydrodipicolinate reductase
VPIKVLHVGLGPIGVGVVQEVAARPALSSVGAVDADPAKVGKDLGEIARLRRRFGVSVSTDLAKTIRALHPDIVVLCTGSALKSIWPDVETILKLKVPIVSTTEELARPSRAHAALAKRIDALAKRSRVAVLGTGVNPGFMMDALPIALTGLCSHVDAIEVHRVQDARIRRIPFQQKIGAGLTPAEFADGVKHHALGHVGLVESISMIADAMGWKLDRISEEIHPRLADRAVTGGHVTVEAGQVAGIVQDGVGYRKGKALVTLHLEAYLGAPETFDTVRILGRPALSMRLDGVHGDTATAAIVANSIPNVIAAAPGLRTMAELRLPSWFSGKSR